MRYFNRILICMAAAMVPLAGHAMVTDKDVQVAARILSFVADPPVNTVKLGIVYDPAVAASMADEQALLQILGTGLAIRGIEFVPVTIPLDKLGAVPADMFFLTSGLGAAAAPLAAQSVKSKTLCMTTDLPATQAGYCAINIQTVPKVQITINKAAATASGGGFVSAFLMMVTEI